jgi:hypothetical protein
MNNFAFLKIEMGPKKSKCIFNEQLQKKFPFITKTSVWDSHVRCKTCASSFSISCSGRGDIKTDFNGEKHKRAICAAASGWSLTTF